MNYSVPCNCTVEAPKAVLSVRETAKYLSVSESLIWSEIKRGKLKPLRIGDRILFSRVYLERLLAAQ